MVKILYAPSPNHSKRRGVKPSSVIVHYSAGADAEATVRWLQGYGARVSYHWIISRTGRIWQLVKPERAAWHCEPAEVPVNDGMVSSGNRHTLSICLANAGKLYRDVEHGCWRIPGTGQYSDSWRVYPDKYPPPEHAAMEWDSVGVDRAEGWWEPYTDEQLRAMEDLLKQECGSLPVIGHDEVAMPLGRKRDPGPLFPIRYRRERPRCWRVLTATGDNSCR